MILTPTTLAFAVSNIFKNDIKTHFLINKIEYKHVRTLLEEREDGRGLIALEVAYNTEINKYEVFNVSDEDGCLKIKLIQ